MRDVGETPTGRGRKPGGNRPTRETAGRTGVDAQFPVPIIGGFGGAASGIQGVQYVPYGVQ